VRAHRAVKERRAEGSKGKKGRALKEGGAGL